MPDPVQPIWQEGVLMNGVAVQDQPYVDQQGSALLELAGLAGSGEALSLEQLRAKAAAELQRFGLDLGSHLAALGIGVPPALQLRMGDDGAALCLISEHDRADEVAAFLREQSRLAKWFKELELLHEIIRRVEVRGTDAESPNERFNVGLTSIGTIAFFTRV